MQKGSELLDKYAPGHGMDSDKLEEARANMEAARKEALDTIDSRIAILKNISETNTVKGSLMRLKNKFMQRLRGF